MKSNPFKNLDISHTVWFIVAVIATVLLFFLLLLLTKWRNGSLSKKENFQSGSKDTTKLETEINDVTLDDKELELFDNIKNNKLSDSDIDTMINNGVLNSKVMDKFMNVMKKGSADQINRRTKEQKEKKGNAVSNSAIKKEAYTNKGDSDSDSETIRKRTSSKKRGGEGTKYTPDFVDSNNKHYQDVVMYKNKSMAGDNEHEDALMPRHNIHNIKKALSAMEDSSFEIDSSGNRISGVISNDNIDDSTYSSVEGFEGFGNRGIPNRPGGRFFR